MIYTRESLATTLNLNFLGRKIIDTFWNFIIIVNYILRIENGKV